MDDKKDGNFDSKSALAMEEVKLADVSGEDTKDTKAFAQDDCIAGPSKTPEDPPPAFVADISKDKVALAEFPVPPPAEAPPEFTTYEASVCTEGDGDVVSHDPHLNNDGEALYRFLLQQSIKPPNFILNCSGTHQEMRTRQVTENVNGRTITRQEHYYVTITDFDFSIDVMFSMKPRLTHFTIADTEPAYRGKCYREIATSKSLRKARGKETSATKDWATQRRDRGLPPWVPMKSVAEWDQAMVDGVGDGVYHSTKTVREWADEYCQSPKLLKEFIYEKSVYGWDLRGLETRIRDSIITNTYYPGSLSVQFWTQAETVHIRPDNRLSRALDNVWYIILLCITFIYPFILLFKRLHPLGGGKFAVAGGAYALKYWEPGEGPEGAVKASDGTTRHLVGMQESDWFRTWQPTILKAVEHRYLAYPTIYQPIVSAEAALDMRQSIVPDSF